MRPHALVSLASALLLIAAIFIGLTTGQPASAAPPFDETAAQTGNVTLEKSVSAQVVPLGDYVTYTVVIENNSGVTIEPVLTDTMPEGLVLRTDHVTATSGLYEIDRDGLHWRGTLEPGQAATIKYQANPPSTGAAGLPLTNVAIVEVDGQTLSAGVTITTAAGDFGWWRVFVNLIGTALIAFDRMLTPYLPYHFGFAIILFTVSVRLITFPLNLQQIKSAKAMQALQPELKKIQAKHKDDREKLAQEQMALYREHGVNPLGGCLPVLVQMPIWIALYQALFQLSAEGLLTAEGFFWIPSLAGPVADYSAGISWLFPLVDGAPPVGWSNALAYLALPVVLVISQFYMQQTLTPQTDDPQQQTMQQVMKFMPLMFGYFSLIVPSGLTLYWFTSNILALAQHHFTRTRFDKPPALATATANNNATAVDTTVSESTNPIDSQPSASTNGNAGTSNKQQGSKSKNAKKRKSKRKR